MSKLDSTIQTILPVIMLSVLSFSAGSCGKSTSIQNNDDITGTGTLVVGPGATGTGQFSALYEFTGTVPASFCQNFVSNASGSAANVVGKSQSQIGVCIFIMSAPNDLPSYNTDNFDISCPFVFASDITQLTCSSGETVNVSVTCYVGGKQVFSANDSGTCP